MSKILIIASTHGHERIGLSVIKELQKITAGNINVEYIVGNPTASKQNIAFVESDLNRVFPGKPDGTLEERRAFELSPKVLASDIVIDIHSTNTTDLSDESMLIVTKYDEQTKRIINFIRPPKVLVMKYKNDVNLISQAKVGIGIEYGRDTSEKVLQAIICDLADLLVSLGVINSHTFTARDKNYNTEVFEVYDAYHKRLNDKFQLDPAIKNFTLVLKHTKVGSYEDSDEVASEDFYPILFGENRYKDILGFKARSI